MKLEDKSDLGVMVVGCTIMALTFHTAPCASMVALAAAWLAWALYSTPYGDSWLSFVTGITSMIAGFWAIVQTAIVSH